MRWKVAGKHKYHAKPCKIDGIGFASKKEAARYAELLLLLKAVEISGLEVHPRFDLHGVDGQKVCRYEADFQYRDTKSGKIIVEDVKGCKTRGYEIKRKLFIAEYPYLTHIET